ncbi:MAG: undecaprenyl-diphosphate phosphatase, partial [Candidatus Babeliales bacterium]
FVIKIGMHDFFENLGPNFLLFGFIITMLLLFSLRLIRNNSTSTALQVGCYEPFDFKKAIILGAVQGCALLPGISRFASTYVAGCWLKISPRRAFQISFLIHLPLIVAAFLFLGIKDIFKKPELFQNLNAGFGTHGFFLILSATIIAILALNLCYKLAVKNKLWWLGFYMLIPIIILIACN